MEAIWQDGDVVIVPASEADAPAIKSVVTAAYTKYIERIGKPPAPMTFDYAAQMKHYDIYILRRRPSNQDNNSIEQQQEVLGSIVLSQHQPEDDVLYVNNVVVDPAQQGHGYGRKLMEFADQIAVRRKVKSIMLYTNEKMSENIAIYPKLGYVEVERKEEDGFNRVYFRKDFVTDQAI